MELLGQSTRKHLPAEPEVNPGNCNHGFLGWARIREGTIPPSSIRVHPRHPRFNFFCMKPNNNKLPLVDQNPKMQPQDAEAAESAEKMLEIGR
jgi:hypothetical protein